jgi:hypothetical protein
MRSRLVLTIALVVVAAAVAGVLVAVASADDTGKLPDLSASELIARMGDHAKAPQAVSGDISWTNDLFGELPFMPDHAAQPAQSPLMTSGSGRMWTQDAKVRLESQGQGGDQVLVADAKAGTLWTYTFVDDTAHLYRWDPDQMQGAGDATAGDGEPQAAPSPEALTPERVSGFLEAASRFMTVEVDGQTLVAGRDAYVLTMTPAATDTALGKIEAAIDGETFVPLRVDVMAKGSDAPTLSFGFTRISYDPVDDAVFAFTPPEGAKVERDTIDAGGDGHDAAEDAQPKPEGDRTDAMEQMKELARTALLTRPEAAELVDFPLAWARDYTARDFRWAYVFDEGMPVNALGAPVFDMAGMFAGASGEGAGTSGDAAGGSPPLGPAAVLLYGEGFGSIVLAQTKTTADLREQLKQLPQVVDTIDVGGAPAKAVVTPLGSVVMWERDGVTLVAAGMVPKADIVEFVTSVR